MKQHISDAQRQVFVELVDAELHTKFCIKDSELRDQIARAEKDIGGEYLLDALSVHDGLYSLVEQAKDRGLDAKLHVSWRVVPDSEAAKALTAEYVSIKNEITRLIRQRSDLIARIWIAETTDDLMLVLRDSRNPLSSE